MAPDNSVGDSARAAQLLQARLVEAADPLNVQTEDYVLLVLFPYYNHLVGINLLRAGLTVRWVESLEAAWTVMKPRRPSVVVCWVGRNWIGRSHPDGLEMIKRLRASEFADVPAFAIIGERCKPEEALASGATEAFVVPFTPKDFVRRINSLM